MQAVAGTHTVLLGFDLDDPAGCLGFAIHRTDHTEGEAYWLRGLKAFRAVVPAPCRRHRTVSLQRRIRCRASSGVTTRPSPSTTTPSRAWSPGAATPAGVHRASRGAGGGAHRGRGRRRARDLVQPRASPARRPSSQRFAGSARRRVDADEDHPAFVVAVARAGRGVRCRFVARGADGAWSGGCAARSTSSPGRPGWPRPAPRRATRGADVRLVVHGRDRDAPVGNGPDDTDRTAELTRAAVATATGIDDVVTWRYRARTRARCSTTSSWCCPPGPGSRVAVWTGSTNLTQGAVYGHLNVGHQMRRSGRSRAAVRSTDWARLAGRDRADPRSSGCATRVDQHRHASSPVPGGIGHGPLAAGDDQPAARTGTPTRSTRGTSSAHITGAFGLNAVFRHRLRCRPGRWSPARCCSSRGPTAAAGDPDASTTDVRISTGSHLAQGDPFAAVGDRAPDGLQRPTCRYIHTKIVLVDPLGPDPIDRSPGRPTTPTPRPRTNEENTARHPRPVGTAVGLRRARSGGWPTST